MPCNVSSFPWPALVLTLSLATGPLAALAQLPAADSVATPRPLASTSSPDEAPVTLRQGRRSITGPLLLPALLLGTAVLTTERVEALETDEAVREEVREHFLHFHSSLDNQLRHVPAVAVLGLSLAGVKGQHGTLNQGLIFFLTYTINNGLTSNLKHLTRVERPYGNDFSSFPSQHTSAAFAAATFMHREYGGRSIWYSVGGYAVATATGAMRVLGNKHWTSDVLAGAGVGILSTELAYWAYPLVHRLLLRGLHDRALVAPLYSHGALGLMISVPLR